MVTEMAKLTPPALPAPPAAAAAAAAAAVAEEEEDLFCTVTVRLLYWNLE